MSGNTSETRCKWCQSAIVLDAGLYLSACEGRVVSHCRNSPSGSHEPTPPEGEAVPEQKETLKYWQCPNNEAHSLKFGAKIYGTSTYRMYCLNCPDTVAVFRSKPIPPPVVSTAAPEPPKCVLLRCACGQVSYVTEAELIGMDRGTVYSCPKCGLALTSANKTNKARSAVAPESYRPAEGPEIKVQRYDPIAEIQEIANNLAKSGDCIGSLKLEAAINILRPAATPVTVEAFLLCTKCGGFIYKCVKFGHITPDSHLGAVRA